MLSIRFTGTSPDEFEQIVSDMRKPIAAAATGAIADAGSYIKTFGREAIGRAGFGSRWQNALRVNLYPSTGTSYNPVAFAFHRIPYAGVFEDGATIAGSPYLWLPLPGVPTSLFGKHISPALYTQTIGPLHIIIVPGRPPMLAAYMVGKPPITVAKLVAGSRARARAKPGSAARVISVPLFFALDTVTIGKKFNLQGVFNKAAGKLGEFYLRRLRL